MPTDDIPHKLVRLLLELVASGESHGSPCEHFRSHHLAKEGFDFPLLSFEFRLLGFDLLLAFRLLSSRILGQLLHKMLLFATVLLVTAPVLHKHVSVASH
jgi:hypothetical protein